MKAIFMVVHSFKSSALNSVNTLPRTILQCLLNLIELIISLEGIEFGGFEQIGFFQNII